MVIKGKSLKVHLSIPEYWTYKNWDFSKVGTYHPPEKRLVVNIESKRRESKMKYEELLEEAKSEIEEEYKEMAKEQLKERLREIKETEKALTKMRKGLEKLAEEVE